MSEFKGDYLGFTYNRVHSSVLGIVRTSNGSRFDENLLPTLQDKTVPVPGGDGTYYFGSYYTQRQFSIPIAFDNLTEAQFERLRAHFGDKQIHDLIFDESPYKIYRAKVTGTATIKHIPFDEKNGRIYKGEGTIQFTCYSPYAICTQKYLNQYDNANVDEWSVASGLLEQQGNCDKLVDNTIQTYNPGVKPADWVLTISTQGSCGCLITLGEKDSEIGIEIYWGNQLPGFPKQLVLDSKSNLIKADDEIYNEYVDSGDFFQIPVGEGKITLVKLDEEKNPIPDPSEWAAISYNYYYF